MSAMYPSKEEIESYVTENYGSCAIGMGRCHCLGPRSGCPHWVPLQGEEKQKIIGMWQAPGPRKEKL